MTRESFPIASPGWMYLFVLAAVTGVSYWFFKPASYFTGSLFLFTAYFFRNPRRRIPSDGKAVLSPADGVVMTVSDVQEERYLNGPSTRVSIFLSVLNVHVNRTPVAGRVEYVSYIPGKFLPAFKSHASEINERNYIGIDSSGLKFLVCQVTGFIARRIVCYARSGDWLDRGQSFGMIKFGSCTEIYVPDGVKICVKPGDRVKGGETIIGRIPHEN
ncbi:MAG: phosphatidylserine decarboxylase [Peptococcaceae bacterium BICA1-7]|nr:MAG: phosphatidylserine decarboxylase [Peptococcaceae bacterium BICA1-7]HBV97627.1 phosphatidylserine decarboxylase family protein [Desulfotomaculum sp.]